MLGGNILTPEKFEDRLDELQSIEDGWLDGIGLAPTKSGLEWIRQLFKPYYLEDLPYLYPTVTGNIQAEWSFPEHEVSVLCNLTTHEGDLFILNTKNFKEYTELLRLEGLDLLTQIREKIREI